MKYVLQSEDWYIHPNGKVGYKLGKAKVFKSRMEAKSFSALPIWKAPYVVIAITEEDLFKARLSDT